MALNVFSNSTALNITNTGSINTDIPLSVNSPDVLRVTATANIKIQLPDPTLCKNKVIEIANTATGSTAQVLQYNATAYTGAPIVLPNAVTPGDDGKLSAGASAVSSTGSKYASARYWCTGTTWVLLSASVNSFTS